MGYHSGSTSSPAVGKGSSTVGLFVSGLSLSKMHHTGAALEAMRSLNCFLGVASCR